MFVILVSVLLVGSAVPAGAAERPKAERSTAERSTAEYSADSTMETADMVMSGTVHAAPGKERRESDMGGKKTVTIVRQDKKVIWILTPEDKTYMEMKLGQGGERQGDLSGYKTDLTTIGPDTVNGIRTTKNKIFMTGPKGEKLAGFSWITKEGIVVKMDAIAVDKSSKERIKSELTNLKIGRQEPSLFEIPEGYSKMDMGMGMGMGMGRKMKPHDGNDDNGEPPPEEMPKKRGFGLKDAIKLFQ